VNERVCSTILGNPHDADYMDMLVDWANQAESKKGLTNTGRGKMAKKRSAREHWIRKELLLIKKAYTDKGRGRLKITTIEELGFVFHEDK
jgi:hypothetical protein